MDLEFSFISLKNRDLIVQAIDFEPTVYGEASFFQLTREVLVPTIWGTKASKMDPTIQLKTS